MFERETEEKYFQNLNQSNAYMYVYISIIQIDETENLVLWGHKGQLGVSPFTANREGMHNRKLRTVRIQTRNKPTLGL